MEQLRSFFASLKAAGTKLSIITKGNVGACRYLLENEGLLQFFEQVFGMLGQFYGESDFDRANPEPSPLEGSADCELRESKANLIRNLMSRASLGVDEACLVEDDAQEIASVQGICRSVFVAERRGMTESEMDELRRLAGATASEAAEAKAFSKVAPKAALTAKPQAAPPPPPPDGFSGVCKVGGKSVPPGKGPAAPAPPPSGFSGVFKSGSTVPAAKASPKQEAAQSGEGLKHVYFDFDQTVSKIHVFKQLAGWEPGVDAPHALSERGQIHRLKMLNEAGPAYVYDGNGVQVVHGSTGSTASWTACSLGGPRVYDRPCNAGTVQAATHVVCCPSFVRALGQSPHSVLKQKHLSSLSGLTCCHSLCFMYALCEDPSVWSSCAASSRA